MCYVRLYLPILVEQWCISVSQLIHKVVYIVAYIYNVWYDFTFF